LPRILRTGDRPEIRAKRAALLLAARCAQMCTDSATILSFAENCSQNLPHFVPSATRQHDRRRPGRPPRAAPPAVNRRRPKMTRSAWAVAPTRQPIRGGREAILLLSSRRGSTWWSKVESNGMDPPPNMAA
jgi:hypothetical protein